VEPLIALDGVRFAYPGRPPTLNGVDLSVMPGERVTIAGPNGAGKSTLLKIVVGLLRPAAGTVTAFGALRTEEADFREVRRRAGLVFQDPDDMLFSPTVAEDVAFGPLNLGRTRGEADAIAARALAALDLSHLAHRITHRLSDGEKRIVTLAAVLAMEPEILLLDEPTNALDEANEARILEILLSLPQAMVVVSHDTAFRARIGTRALRLSGGRLDAA